MGYRDSVLECGSPLPLSLWLPSSRSTDRRLRRVDLTVTGRADLLVRWLQFRRCMGGIKFHSNVDLDAVRQRGSVALPIAGLRGINLD